METFSLAVCFLCVSRENLETRTVGGGRGGGASVQNSGMTKLQE